MDIGPRSVDQFRRMARDWEQGEHVIISGSTGSGKTTLARRVDQIRIDRGGFVVVFVCKLLPDKTIEDDYKGFTRWTEWKKNPSRFDNRILLWPDTSKGKTLKEKRAIQRQVFSDALDAISNKGKWTIHVDEGLYFCGPTMINLADELEMMHALGRSANCTIITLTQRPSHLPLIIYSSASHAFIGRTREATDNKRLSELGGRHSAKELSTMINQLGRRDFLWLPVALDLEPETVNLKN